jgi:VWFA-related protein
MPLFSHLRARAVLTISSLLCLCVSLSTTRAQQPQNESTQATDDVVRINTELIQTDVMVFDRQGRFVDGLKPEQFELRVDGKPVQVSFFERVTAGSVNEEAQIAAARGGANPSAIKDSGVKPLDRGRIFFFFVDDLHQSFESMRKTQQVLLDFIDKRLGQNDSMAITSTTGQIGFLQQLTDNKQVLRAAVARLKLGTRIGNDNQHPPMSESMALAIEVKQDDQVFNYFVDTLVEDGTPRDMAENLVHGRAQQILQQSSFFANRTLSALENLTRTSAGYPGRKVVFFLSDGFVLDNTESQTAERIRNITNAAAHNGVVIYTLDPQGLTTGDLGKSSEETAFDPTGRLSAYTSGSSIETQEPLRVLAGNTGGRALLNTNKPEAEIPRALAETSVYYLLAWRPQGEEQRSNKFRRIEVKVAGRPELSVQVRGGYYDINAQAAAKRGKAEVKEGKPALPKTSDAELREAIKALYPARALPLQLSLSYMDVPQKGLLLSAAAQIDSGFVTYEQAENKSKAVVDIAGIIFTDQGKPVGSFKDRIDIVADPAALTEGVPRAPLLYNFPSYLSPGLYQVRVAARDSKSGRVGSASAWIELPDLSSHRLSLSSLLVGEITKGVGRLNTDPTAIAGSRLSVDHRFDRTSKLRFLTFIYNASRGANGASSPDLALQVQVLRDDQPVITTPLRKVQNDGVADLARIAYAAEIPLEGMPAGRYILQVTAIDRIAKTSASQRVNFEIE